MNESTANQAVGVSQGPPASTPSGQQALRLVRLGDANAVACEGDACLIVPLEFSESAANRDQ